MLLAWSLSYKALIVKVKLEHIRLTAFVKDRWKFPGLRMVWLFFLPLPTPSHEPALPPTTDYSLNFCYLCQPCSFQTCNHGEWFKSRSLEGCRRVTRAVSQTSLCRPWRDTGWEVLLWERRKLIERSPVREAQLRPDEFKLAQLQVHFMWRLAFQLLLFIWEVAVCDSYHRQSLPEEAPVDLWAFGMRAEGTNVWIERKFHCLPGIYEIREKGADGPEVKELLCRLANCWFPDRYEISGGGYPGSLSMASQCGAGNLEMTSVPLIAGVDEG